MKLADLLSTDEASGRALLDVPTYPAVIVLPCHVRDIRVMGRGRQWLVGAERPGMTWRDGVFISERLFPRQRPVDLIDLFLHECTHWWQMWRRMGPNDFSAGYLWQAVDRLFRGPVATLHDRLDMEREATGAAYAMRGAITDLLRSSRSVFFDTLPWLTQHYPPRR